MFVEHMLDLCALKIGISYKAKSLRDGLPRMWRSFSLLKKKKAVEILFVIRYCLVATQKQLNTESPTAYE